MIRPFKQVDVFTDRLGAGNPVAVVLEADGMSDAEMAAFARWTNLSETTFVLTPTDPDADYWVRIFTPTVEFPFAGHPTIGTCHAWLEAGGTPKTEGVVIQQCGAGLVTLRNDGGRLAFETPGELVRSGPVEDDFLAQVIADVGLAPDQVVATSWADNGPGWIGILVDSVETLRSLEPSWERLDCNPGVAALTGEIDPALEVRAFFYAGGSREDPVTGSLNGSLAQWLLGDERIEAPYVASQGTSMQRDGRVYIDRDNAGGVWIGGDAVTGVDGVVNLP